MKIDCYLSLSCGAEIQLRENISLALAAQETEADVNFFRVDDDEARRLGLGGSPTIRIDDEEIQPRTGGAFS